MKTPEELETFMLKHGENIIDTLGAEVDRLEKELKVRYIYKNNMLTVSLYCLNIYLCQYFANCITCVLLSSQ